MAPIVVGVDGSEGSKRALSWALAEARRLGDPVRVVHAWWTPPEYAAYPVIAEVHDSNSAEHQQAGESVVQRMLDEAKAEADGVDVDAEVVNEPAAQALIDRSDGADRIVVGSRGLGGFRSLLLGSVSQQLVQHARCPVVVVPAHE